MCVIMCVRVGVCACVFGGGGDDEEEEEAELALGCKMHNGNF